MEPYEQLEVEFAEWAGVANTVACSSGTSALQLALTALRLPPGSRVLVPEFTMVACARAVVMAGLVPVFVDCDDEGLIDVTQLYQRCLDELPDAVMAVHVYGRQCD